MYFLAYHYEVCLAACYLILMINKRQYNAHCQDVAIII